MTTETRGRVRIEEGAKRVRALLGGVTVVDTIHPRLVWESPMYPAYYIPESDVRMDLLTPSGRVDRSPSRGDAHHFDVQVGETVAKDAAWHYPDAKMDGLAGLIRFDWAAMDAWFEEDEEVFTHPRDPYKRVDILPSSRHVEVSVNGVTVADSHSPTLLFETGLPTRYYLPLTDIRADLLRPSGKSTSCPYKGTAAYWSLEVAGETFENIVWTYTNPLPESTRITGLASFYNEHVDITVDGVLQDRPKTVFTRPAPAE